jgi:hypothetical protein
MEQLVRQSDKLTGLDRIRLERQRQVNDEKFSHEYDAGYVAGQLRRAAACYETAALHGDDPEEPPKGWPWDKSWWKPRGILRNLERAGALYQADLDRMGRSPKDSQKELVLFIEKRIEIIAEEIERFLAPLPGDKHLQNDRNRRGEMKHSFALMNQFNQENASDVKLIAGTRKVTSLYFDEHLRRKLAVARDPNERNPSGSIMNAQEVCGCDTGFMCGHRLEWLMGYLKRAHYNLMVRHHEASNTIDQLTLQLEDAQEALAKFQNPKADDELDERLDDIGNEGDL